MNVSALAVRRPVLAGVASALIVVAGLISFRSLPLRELPDVDNPVVSVSASYPGANAEVVENRVTRVIEDQLNGIDGVDTIQSQSSDGRSNINITFELSRDLEAAANDVRDRVSRVTGALPSEVDNVEVSKQDGDAQPIMWAAISSDSRSTAELSDYVRRNIVDRVAVIDGVAAVRGGGGQDYAMRIDLDRREMAARGITVDDVENALRRQNVELPGGAIESDTIDLTVRVERSYMREEEFRRLPVGQSTDDGHVIRLGEVADVYLGVEELRSLFRGDGLQRVGVGIVRQSKSNAIEVSDRVIAELERIQETLPEDITIQYAQDNTKFVRAAVREVWVALGLSFLLVVVIIYLFLGSIRAVFIPAVVVPVSLIGCFTILAAFGFTINILTLLALVLAIGLVVDDSIVVLENIQRRIDMGEPRLIAADRGARQVFFAVVATTAVVVAVFAPLAILSGYVGRLFVELALTISGAVVISAFVALTLSPMMASKLLAPRSEHPGPAKVIEKALDVVTRSYAASLEVLLARRALIAVIMIAIAGGAAFMFTQLKSELTPPEDRGQIMVQFQASEGAGYGFTAEQASEIEAILLDYVRSGEASTAIIRVPGFGGSGNSFNSGMGILPLAPWTERHRSGLEIQREIAARVNQLTGVRAFAGMQAGFGGGGQGNDIQLVLTGPDYELLSQSADDMIAAMAENSALQNPRKSYEQTNPRLVVDIDRERAAAIGVSVQSIGRALEAQLGSRRVGQFVDGGEGYDIIMQNKIEDRRRPDDLTNIFVRSEASGQLIPLTNLVRISEEGDASSLPRVNRARAVSISITLASGYSLGDAVTYLNDLARQVLPAEVRTEYLGAAKELREANNAVLFAFVMALLIVFLVLAAQFESLISPIVIMLTVPLAVAGGLFGLLMANSSLNIYSQIGLIILVGLAAKNGILLVEFANQLREAGRSIREATIESAATRLRPILMTSAATAIGALPLVFSHGAGAESRMTIGVVVFSGVLVATLFTLIVVPVFYALLARYTRAPGWVAREIAEFEGTEGRPGHVGHVPESLAPAE